MASFFNNREAIAEAIIGLLLVFIASSRVFATELCALCHFALLVERFLFIRVIKLLVTRALPHSQKWVPLSETDFSLFQRDNVKWVYITLIEDYLRPANISSNKL